MKKNTKKIWIIVAVLLLAAAGYGCYRYFLVGRIAVNGQKDVTLEYGTDYSEEGAVFTAGGKQAQVTDISVPEDISEIGSHVITYSYENSLGQTVSAQRTVTVKDTTPPLITLNGESHVKVEFGNEYAEEGCSSVDNHDGDITDKVTVEGTVNVSELGEYVIKYVSVDASGNTAEVERTVTVTDETGPVITVEYPENTFAILGHPFDVTAKATDNHDGDVSDKVTVSGNVDFDTEGVYTLEYRCKDSSNNESVLLTHINVQPANTTGIPVLMYHWFYDDEAGEKPYEVANIHNYVKKSNFEAQLKYLTENHYWFASWQQLIDYIDGNIQLPAKTVILTSDDGQPNFFDIALPIAIKYHVPVTSFVITSWNTFSNYFDVDVLDIESHSHQMHKYCKLGGRMRCMSQQEIEEDMKTSLELIQGHSWAMAYPFGHHTDAGIRALQNVGIMLAFTTEYGKVKPGMNHYLLPRVRISHDDSLDNYIRKVSP